MLYAMLVRAQLNERIDDIERALRAGADMAERSGTDVAAKVAALRVAA